MQVKQNVFENSTLNNVENNDGVDKGRVGVSVDEAMKVWKNNR